MHCTKGVSSVSQSIDLCVFCMKSCMETGRHTHAYLLRFRIVSESSRPREGKREVFGIGTRSIIWTCLDLKLYMWGEIWIEGIKNKMSLHVTMNRVIDITHVESSQTEMIANEWRQVAFLKFGLVLLLCVQLRGTFDKYTTWRDWIRSLERIRDVGHE